MSDLNAINLSTLRNRRPELVVRVVWAARRWCEPCTLVERKRLSAELRASVAALNECDEELLRLSQQVALGVVNARGGTE